MWEWMIFEIMAMELVTMVSIAVLEGVQSYISRKAGSISMGCQRWTQGGWCANTGSGTLTNKTPGSVCIGGVLYQSMSILTFFYSAGGGVRSVRRWLGRKEKSKA